MEFASHAMAFVAGAWLGMLAMALIVAGRD